jgi:hypothetical protein
MPSLCAAVGRTISKGGSATDGSACSRRRNWATCGSSGRARPLCLIPARSAGRRCSGSIRVPRHIHERTDQMQQGPMLRSVQRLGYSRCLARSGGRTSSESTPGVGSYARQERPSEAALQSSGVTQVPMKAFRSGPSLSFWLSARCRQRSSTAGSTADAASSPAGVVPSAGFRGGPDGVWAPTAAGRQARVARAARSAKERRMGITPSHPWPPCPGRRARSRRP